MTSGRHDGVPLAEWGQRVGAARRALGLTQRALADRSDVTQQTISKVERGRMCPHDGVKVRLARGLECDPSEIFVWAD